MMKKTFTLIAIMLLLATQMFAQKLSYQAVIRNSNNELVYNATLTVEVSILGPSQNVLYSQTIQNVTSNQNGLITIQIGDDSPAWRAINWSDATIRSVIKDGTTTVATVNSAVSAVPLAIQTLNGSNGERVQADWEETDQNSPAFIQNKPTIPAAPDLSGYVTDEQLQNAGYLRYESQSLSDVAAYGNDAGSRQLKGLADPTDAQDAVTLSYLTTQLNALQQQLAQLGQVVAAQQAVIDSLTNGGSDTTGGPTTAQAPSVTSSSADLISENEATLFAYVSNPDSVTITSKGFEYKVSGSANYTTAECYVNSQDDNGFGIYAPLYNLTAGTEYTYRAFVTTAEGTNYGSEGTFTTTSVDTTTFNCGTSTIQDIDGNVYNTVQIGHQCWMRDNLRTTHYTDGTPITLATPSGSHMLEEPPYYYDDANSEISLEKRGYYYNLPAVMHGADFSDANPSGVQGPCPMGWHVPSDSEWGQLMQTTVNKPESLGFPLTLAGALYATTFERVGEMAFYWTSSYGGEGWNSYYQLAITRRYYFSYWDSNMGSPSDAYSVRCVRDENGGSTAQIQPFVTSSSADLITENTATLFAKVSNPDSVTVTSKGFEYKVSGSANYTTVNGYENYHNGTVFGIYAPLYNLTAGTEYTYRAFVTTAEGTNYGSEGTFTTTEDSASCSSLGDLIGQHGNVLRFPINDYSADKINASASGYLVYYNSHDNIWSPCLEVTKSAYDNLVNINDSLVFECVIQFNMLQDYAGQTVKIYPYLILVGCNDDRSWIPSYSVDLVVPTINTSASVGDILLEDNSWVSPNDFDSTSMTAKGVIFHVDETGQHGWAVNLQDEGQSASFQWSTIEEDIADLPNCYDSNTDTAGYQNTRAILQAGDATTYPAANTVSFVDGWYLPAIGQLAVLMQNFEDVNASLGRVNGIAIDGFWYYSSSEIGSSGAWSVYYDEHIINWGRKSTSLKVRSVRSF